MDGSIRLRKQQDGSKRYQARYSRPHPSKAGQRLVSCKTFPKKGDAQSWLAEQHVRHSRDPHARPDRAKQLFPALVEQWTAVRAASLEPKTRARYAQVVRTHLLPEFGNAAVGDISREWVRDFLAQLSATDIAPGTVHKVKTTLSSIMAEAVERNMLSANPCHGVSAKVVRRERRKMQVLTPPEVHALADAITPHYRTLILTAAFTGLRAGELHALRRRDVDLPNGTLTVERALKVWKDGTPTFGPTKTDEPRQVALAPELVEELSRLPTLSSGGLVNRPDHGHSSPAVRPKPDDLVFVNANGTAIHQVAWLRNHFKPARVRALPDHEDLRFHDLRHTFVSLLIQQGVNVKAIAAQAGHARAAMTLDVYGHLFPGDDAPVREALSAAWTTPAAEVIELRPSA
jgi:integrase